MEKFQNQKSKVALRGWLEGRSYFKALEAMELGIRYHRGLRKDGTTPEFHHQISQVNYLRTLEPHLMYPQETFIVCFLHDIVEDYGYSLEKINEQFGPLVARGVELLTKAPDFEKTEWHYTHYYAKMHQNPIASIVKGSDRIHNHQSMVGVLPLERQKAYIHETLTFILPMLKLARREFPSQVGAFYNIKTLLKSQIELVEAIVKPGIDISSVVG